MVVKEEKKNCKIRRFEWYNAKVHPKRSLYATCTSPIRPPPPPPKKKNCISIVFNFFGTAVIPGEMKNKGYKNFGGQKRCITEHVQVAYRILSCFVPRPRYCARPMRFASRGRSSRIRHRNALTKKAWEDAVQGLNKILSTDAKVITTNQTLRYSKNYDIVRSSRTKDQGLG